MRSLTARGPFDLLIFYQDLTLVQSPGNGYGIRTRSVPVPKYGNGNVTGTGRFRNYKYGFVTGTGLFLKSGYGNGT